MSISSKTREWRMTAQEWWNLTYALLQIVILFPFSAFFIFLFHLIPSCKFFQPAKITLTILGSIEIPRCFIRCDAHPFPRQEKNSMNTEQSRTRCQIVPSKIHFKETFRHRFWGRFSGKVHHKMEWEFILLEKETKN